MEHWPAYLVNNSDIQKKEGTGYGRKVAKRSVSPQGKVYSEL